MVNLYFSAKSYVLGIIAASGLQSNAISAIEKYRQKYVKSIIWTFKQSCDTLKVHQFKIECRIRFDPFGCLKKDFHICNRSAWSQHYGHISPNSQIHIQNTK